MIKIGTALFEATEELEREKGISKEVIIESLKDALVAAYKKHIKVKEAPNVEAILDEVSGEIGVFRTKLVVENVSRSLNPFLDEIIPVKFYLEVSSPGLDRKLKSDKEYIIFQGKLINLKLKSLIEGTEEKQFLCKILDFDPENGLKVLKIDENKELIVPKDKIYRAQLQIEDI